MGDIVTLTPKEIDKRFDEHHGRIHKVEVDVYFGEGKDNPPITTRLASLEDFMRDTIEDRKQIKWALYGAISLLIANLIMSHVKF
jgi:hypothetical protein